MYMPMTDVEDPNPRPSDESAETLEELEPPTGRLEQVEKKFDRSNNFLVELSPLRPKKNSGTFLVRKSEKRTKNSSRKVLTNRLARFEHKSLKSIFVTKNNESLGTNRLPSILCLPVWKCFQLLVRFLFLPRLLQRPLPRTEAACLKKCCYFLSTSLEFSTQNGFLAFSNFAAKNKAK